MKVINLTRNKFALVDDDSYAVLSKHKWSFHHNGYAVRGKPQVSMHRVVMGAQKGRQLDHINGDKLDNRKENLRFCTTRQNQYNTTHLDGVHWRASRKAWIVRMNVKGKKKFIGYFKKYEQAVKARQEASKLYHGAFSPYVEAS